MDEIVALQVHLTGAPLDNIERELAVYSPTWEVCSLRLWLRLRTSAHLTSPHVASLHVTLILILMRTLTLTLTLALTFYETCLTCLSQGPATGPPTPLHGAKWRRPPPPSARIDVRLLDASILLAAATFSYQDTHDQSAAVDMLAGTEGPQRYVPTRLRTELSMFSVFTSRHLTSRQVTTYRFLALFSLFTSP